MRINLKKKYSTLVDIALALVRRSRGSPQDLSNDCSSTGFAMLRRFLQDLVLQSHNDSHDVFVFSNYPTGDVKPKSETTVRRKNDGIEKAKLATGAVESAGKDGWRNSVFLQSPNDGHDAFVFLDHPIAA